MLAAKVPWVHSHNALPSSPHPLSRFRGVDRLASRYRRHRRASALSSSSSGFPSRSSFRRAATSSDGTTPSTAVSNNAVHVDDLEASVRNSSVSSSDQPSIALHTEHRNDAWESGTQSIHAGERGGRPRISDTVTTPIVQTATFTFRNTAELIDYQEGRYGSYEYGRYGNPTTRAVEEKLKALEGAEAALLSASGMNTATTLLLALVPAGGHIVTTTDCYRRTRQFIQTVLPKMQTSSTVIDPSDLTALQEALEQHHVSLFFTESPTNPYLRVVDVERISEMCHKHGAVVVIDSTFATPINQRAIRFGADLVVHSATKYLAGHNDVLGGAVVGKEELIEAVRSLHNVLGGVIDPHASYLFLRGLKTLKLRVHQHNNNAMLLAKKLEEHPKIRRVYYPGLPSHPDHDIARSQMDAFGGVVSFEVEGDLWRTAKLVDSVHLPYIAPSLGGAESLVNQPAIMSYWDLGTEGRKELGIHENLVRFSCGIEDFKDIWDDVQQALDAI